MIKEQCISVTDLRMRTKTVLENLEKSPKFVFLNNRPVAVLMDVEDYEETFRPNLIELKDEEVSPKLKAAAAAARGSKKASLVNL